MGCGVMQRALVLEFVERRHFGDSGVRRELRVEVVGVVVVAVHYSVYLILYAIKHIQTLILSHHKNGYKSKDPFYYMSRIFCT